MEHQDLDPYAPTCSANQARKGPTWFVFFASMWCHTALALEPGDIAFVGFNANAPDNLAVVTFVDLKMRPST